MGLLRGCRILSETCCSESGHGSDARLMIDGTYTRLWLQAVIEQRDEGREGTGEGTHFATLEQHVFMR